MGLSGLLWGWWHGGAAVFGALEGSEGGVVGACEAANGEADVL